MSWEPAENDWLNLNFAPTTGHSPAIITPILIESESLFFCVRLDGGVEPFAAEWIQSSSKVIGRHCPPAGAQGRARPAAAAAATTTTPPKKCG